MLRRELETVSAPGIAIDDREIADGTMCIAVTVFDGSSGICAALLISMKWSEEAEGRIAELSRLLKGASAKIAKNLGLIPINC